MRAGAVTLASLVSTSLFLVACGKKSADGLAPATEWHAGDPQTAAIDPTAKPQAVQPGTADPHAGIPMGGGGGGGDPHGGMFGGGGGASADPHAGVPGAPPITGGAGGAGAMAMGGGHGGGDMAATMDVTQLGLSSPDPNRPIDPNRRIKGTLKVHPKAKARVTAGAAIFLVVKRMGPDGQPTGSALAVDKLSWSGDALAFELTERQAMVAGTELTGEVIVSARVDQDSDAITKQPGDVTGMTRVKIPADGVVLELDTVL